MGGIGRVTLSRSALISCTIFPLLKCFMHATAEAEGQATCQPDRPRLQLWVQHVTCNIQSGGSNRLHAGLQLQNLVQFLQHLDLLIFVINITLHV